MALQRRTRIALGTAALAPVAFLLAYPWLCYLLPERVEEWTDLPRDLLGFLALDAVVTAVVLVAWRLRGRTQRQVRRGGIARPQTY